MENLAPPLLLVVILRREIERGRSIREALRRYLNETDDEFSKIVAVWQVRMEQGLDFNYAGVSSTARRGLLMLLARGLRGEPILQHLLRLEGEIVESCQDEIQSTLQKLPFILMLPLLLLQFPAFLILLFGPFLENFFHSL